MKKLKKKLLFLGKNLTMPKKTERGDRLRFFNIHFVAKHEKVKKKTFIFGKISHNAKKTERGDPLGFFNIHSVAKHQKNAKGTLRGIFFKKKLAVPKKRKGDPLVSPGLVCYAEK